MRAPIGFGQFAKPKMTEQEETLLQTGANHTALMSASIVTTLIYIYQTGFDGHVVGLGVQPLGVVFALFATWGSAGIEALTRVRTGDPKGETHVQPGCPFLYV
jgi:hypothetical protein